MRWIAAVVGIVMVLGVLWDAFETMIMPRTPQRKVRLTKLFYLYTWKPWSALVRHIGPGEQREALLNVYGPLSLIMLLVIWAVGLIFGFALVQWGSGADIVGPDGRANLGTLVYGSGVTFLTLGYGDVIPRDGLGRVLTVFEAGTGFSFLAIVIGYLPVVFQSFSNREINISLLDEHAGSPPSAGELLRRHGVDDSVDSIDQFLHEWERWAAEVLESHLSYPTLCYWRSQHENQNWLAALTMILDACALVMTGVDGTTARQARLTFAMARHAAIDLTQLFTMPLTEPLPDRLPPAELRRLRTLLVEAGVALRDGPEADRHLAELRAMYEPYVVALANMLLLSLPPWYPVEDAADNWQRTALGREEAGHPF